MSRDAARAGAWAALAGVVLVAAAFRFTGLDWDQGQHLHPDERFLTMVVDAIDAPGSFAEYLDTARSPANPHNRGFDFYVYGTAPVLALKVLGEGTGLSGYERVHLLGRGLAAAADLVVVVLVFLLAARLGASRRGALLAALLYAAAVLPIQLSHFFTVDPFANLVATTALLLATTYATPQRTRRSLWLAAGFGLALGAATACKLSAAPAALLLPLAGLARLAVAGRGHPARLLPGLARDQVLAALLALLAFRLLQPYAFAGPGLLDVAFNPAWLADMRELSALAAGRVEFPPAVQWLERPLTFALGNQVVYGLGVPLGLLSWAAIGVIAWRVLRGHDLAAVPLVAWAIGVTAWVSLSFTSSMRYLLPVYPALAAAAGWALDRLLGRRTEAREQVRRAAVALAVIVPSATLAWAWAFTRIYAREHTRVAASRWLLANVEPAVRLDLDGARVALAPPPAAALGDGPPWVMTFTPPRDAALIEIELPEPRSAWPVEGALLRARLLDARGIELARGDAVCAAGAVCRVRPEPAPLLLAGARVRLELSAADGAAVLGGPVELRFVGESGASRFGLPAVAEQARAGTPLLLPASVSGRLREVRLPRVVVADGPAAELDLRAIGRAGEVALGAVTLPAGGGPVALRTDVEVQAPWALAVAPRGDGVVALEAETLAIESSWDDALPLPVGRSLAAPLRPEINLEIHEPDTEAKRRRLLAELARTDVLVVSSRRQVGSLGRLPDRFPLTAAFYRELLACDQDVGACFASARPGRRGNLGFELAAVFESEPALGPLRLTTQRAEEAFTVYDHPRVLVLRRVATEAPGLARLADVRLADARPPGAGAGRLDPLRLAEQRRAGSWRDVFPPDSVLNRSAPAAAVAWYALLALVGWSAWVLARPIFSALADRGFALARTLGLLLLAWPVWLAGSAGVPVTRATIAAAFALLLAAGGFAAWRQREALRAELIADGRRLVTIELVLLAFFLFGLAIRVANPDLWHPWRGGEKPMDLSLLTATVKSIGFPPYDPWFAGGALNYYYFGFVLVGVPVELLGIAPEIAYNLALPTVLALVAMGAFAVVSSLARSRSIAAGLLGAAMVALLGNLGTLRLVVQRLAGIPETFRGEWYWNPSRALPGDVITEFPFFSFLYGDLHAHLLALPLTLAALAWALAALRSGWPGAERADRSAFVARLALGGLVIGALRATNTWDFPTFLALGAGALVWGVSRGRPLPQSAPRALAAGAGLVAFALAAFAPFDRGFARGYGAVAAWTGARSPLGDFLVHWAVFLVILAVWLAIGTSRRGRRATLAVGGAVGLTLALAGVPVALVASPLALTGLVVGLSRDQDETGRVVALLAVTGLALALAVEVVALAGDVGRMNTVFKLYLQAWTLLGVAAAVALPEVWRAGRGWARRAVRGAIALLLVAAAAYPVTATVDKVSDRMSPAAPIGLNGMSYMDSAIHVEAGSSLDLAPDARAIRWLREHADGTPVILEAHVSEYRWGNRFTVYTGLPGVIGWRWHEVQQRAAFGPSEVDDRIHAVNRFFTTTDRDEAAAILERFAVRYVVVGGLERAVYPARGLEKMEAWDGGPWRRVYAEGQTAIYEVTGR